MAITFPTKAWITGKNTLVLTLPSEINKKHDITKGTDLIITIHNVYPQGHIEYSARGQYQIKTLSEINEKKCEQQKGENYGRTKNEKK